MVFQALSPHHHAINQFFPKPTMRELPHAIGRCSIARHLELNPSRTSVLWVIGLDARPAVAQGGSCSKATTSR